MIFYEKDIIFSEPPFYRLSSYRSLENRIVTLRIKMDVLFVGRIITWVSISGNSIAVICLLTGLGIRLYTGTTTPFSKKISIAGIVIFLLTGVGLIILLQVFKKLI